MVLTRLQKKRHAAAFIIQKRFREHRHMAAVIDPITLDPLSKPIYKYVNTSTNHVHYFQLAPLLEFMSSTGDFRNPVDRRPFNQVQLRTIQRRAVEEGLETPCLDIEQLRRTRSQQVLLADMLSFFSDELSLKIGVALEICSTTTFVFQEYVILLLNWCHSMKVTMLRLLTFVLNFESGCVAAAEGVRSLYTALKSSTREAISGPNYHHAGYVSFVDSVIDHLFSGSETEFSTADIERWLGRVVNYTPSSVPAL